MFPVATVLFGADGRDEVEVLVGAMKPAMCSAGLAGADCKL
jgi:hypothetical protein